MPKNITCLVITLIVVSNSLYAQDTLYRLDGSKQAVKILELNETQVKYRKNSNLDGPIYVVNKLEVIKIVYENGTQDVLPTNVQATLYKSDGSTLSVVILEVNASQVRYKLRANLDGPTHAVSKDDVIKILYDNGVTDVFPVRTSNDEIQIDPRSIDFGRNFISFNITDLMLGSLTFGYEHTFKSGEFSLKFPLSLGSITLGLASQPDAQTNSSRTGYYNRNKIFSTGVDFYFYKFGQGESRFFYGPSLEYGQFNYSYFIGNSNPYPNNYEVKNETGVYYAFLCQTGFLFQPDKHVNISINAGIGYSHTQSTNEGATSQPTLRGTVIIGYKFK